MKVELSYKISLEEFVEAASLQKMNEKKRSKGFLARWQDWLMLVFVFVIAVLISQSREGTCNLAFGLFLVGYLFFAVYRMRARHRCLREIYEDQKSGLEMRVSIAENGIEVERLDRTVSGRYSWSSFATYLEGETVFALFLSRLQFVLISKRVMSVEQCEELRSLASAHIAKKGS